MSLDKLVALLQNAHAGERAAAFAYRGHRWSVTSLQEKNEIDKIEQEEWAHRRCLRKMLADLGAEPRVWRKFIMFLIGVNIAVLCLLGRVLNFFNFGWYMSMYGAGLLEKENISEYEIAAQFAHKAHKLDYVELLLQMAEVEWDHEKYFREKCLGSKWVKCIPTWEPPKDRSEIRQNHNRGCAF